MRRLIPRAVLWVSLYALAAMLPLLFVFIGARPPGRDFWVELSVGVAFIGLGMLALQFLLTARFRRFTSHYGMDVVLHFHRHISFVAMGLVVAHPVILFAWDADTLSLLNVFTAPWRAKAGVAALALLLVLIGASVWKDRLRLTYEWWRATHGLLAVALIAFSFAHVLGVNHYLASPAKRAIWAAGGVLVVALLAYVRVIKPFRMRSRPYRTEAVKEERGRTWTLTLVPDGHDGMPFRGGQFAWLKVDRSPFALREHPFSFSSSATMPARIQFTIKAAGDFTSTVRDIEPGTVAYIDGPYGVFTLERYPAARFVFLAGGVGITTFMSMLRTLADLGDPRHFVLFYATSGLSNATFREELEEVSGRLALDVIHVLEEPPEGWTGESGFITKDVLQRHLPEDYLACQFFVCGPPPMMDAVIGALKDMGVPPGKIQSERFQII